MKRINFFTSKGEFVLVDLPKEIKHIEFARDYTGIYLYWHDGNACLVNDNFAHGEFKFSDSQKDRFKNLGKLFEITEQQASEVVAEPEYVPCHNCLNGCPVCGGYGYSISYCNELHSLIKSKGIYLYENPIEPYWRTSDYVFSEEKTFYNPYLFKKI